MPNGNTSCNSRSHCGLTTSAATPTVHSLFLTGSSLLHISCKCRCVYLASEVCVSGVITACWGNDRSRERQSMVNRFCVFQWCVTVTCNTLNATLLPLSVALLLQSLCPHRPQLSIFTGLPTLEGRDYSTRHTKQLMRASHSMTRYPQLLQTSTHTVISQYTPKTDF